jgi:hypothetical protein
MPSAAANARPRSGFWYRKATIELLSQAFSMVPP